MGGWDPLDEAPLTLWIESAHQSLAKAGAKVCGDVVRTLQTEEQFFVILTGSPLVDSAADMLERGTPLDAVVETVLPTLPADKRTSFSVLQVLVNGSAGECQAHLVECDAPPLFLTRACGEPGRTSSQLVLPPVLEEVSRDHLIRQCRFPLQDGDRLVMVSQGYLRPSPPSFPPHGGDERGGGWSWSDVAVTVRRWADTGCDADELLGALMRTYRRLNPEAGQQDVTVVTMYARPRRTATVWTGPPTDPAQDEVALEKLMAERGTRILCGDTTAQIAARLLESELEPEPRPDDGWAEVPPLARLDGIDLVTEGLVTLNKTREQIAKVKRVRDLPRGENGATHLARALLSADRIHFIVGLAVNPAQAADAAGTIPLRQIVIDDLVQYLKAHDKIISVEYL